MTAVFSTYMRQQLVSNANLFNGANIRAVVWRQSPVLDPSSTVIAGLQTVAAMRAQNGWVEVSGGPPPTGWPVTTSISLFVRLDGANHYATFSTFDFTGITSTEVRAVTFYYVGTVGSVTDPVVFTTDTPFDGQPVLLNAGDAITANPDSTLAGTPNRSMFSWATPGVGVTAVPIQEGPLAWTKAAPIFETSHAQHVWLYPQRANLIANPSFEAVEKVPPTVDYWATNGTLSRVSGGVPEGGAWYGSASGGVNGILVMESNSFPTDGEERWTIQAKIRGTGKLKIGLLWWDATYDTTYSDWGEDEEWTLYPDAWVHITVCRTGFQTFQGAVRFEVQGTALALDEVLVEKDWLTDWPYFDGDSTYGAVGDYSWYGGTNRSGQTYSLWYNNKKAIYGRLFGQDIDNDDVLTNAEIEEWGFIYRWIPAGLSVVPHIDVLYVNDQQAPVPPKTAVTPYNTPGASTGTAWPWPATALSLSGASGNYVSTPDAATFDITGDLCLMAKVTPANWAGGGTIVSKWTGTQCSYQMYLGSVGTLSLMWTVNGSTSVFRQSIAGFSATATPWVAATLDVDNGASGNDVRFWSSLDGVTWTQVGPTITTAGVTSVFASTTPINIGANTGGTASRLTCLVQDVRIYSGIGNNTAPGLGTLVGHLYAAVPWPGTTYTDETGKVWTLNGAKSFVPQP